jgi:hypothetical protein
MGEEIPIDTEAFEDKLAARPKLCRVRFTPRSPKHVELIKKELDNVSRVLNTWE